MATNNENNTEEFENKCMAIIEKIVAKDIRNTRQDAIRIAEEMLKVSKRKTTKQSVIAVFERVLKEFQIATDEEYNLLKKQIFS